MSIETHGELSESPYGRCASHPVTRDIADLRRSLLSVPDATAKPVLRQPIRA
jgi:hypothetical protein